MNQELVKQAHIRIKPTDFMDYRVYLSEFYQFMKVQQGSYSYVKFAVDLGFSPSGIMNQIARGRRPLTLKMARKICEKLDLKGKEKRYLLALVEYTHEKAAANREELFQKILGIKNEVLVSRLDKDTLEYFSEWHHPVVREMVGMKDFKPDPEWMADRLVPRLRPEMVKKSLQLLEKLGLIYWDATASTYRQSAKTLKTAREIQGLAVIRYHQEMIQLGRESITRMAADRRSVTAITINVSDGKARKIMEKIYEFQMQILHEADNAGDGNDQIYQMNVQLFPLTE